MNNSLPTLPALDPSRKEALARSTGKGSPRSFAAHQSQSAFSLTELLVVVGIMIILLTITTAIFNGRSQNMTSAAQNLSDLLQQARTTAMSGNNYVYVGLGEIDSSSPQLVVALVEAKDGLGSKTDNLASAEIKPVQNITILKGVRLDTAAANQGLTGNPLSGTPSSQFKTLEESVITFPSSPSTSRTDIKGSQFSKVLQFSPDGAARVIATKKDVPKQISLGLVPAPAGANPQNVVGFIVDGPSGAVRILRPGMN